MRCKAGGTYLLSSPPTQWRPNQTGHPSTDEMRSLSRPSILARARVVRPGPPSRSTTQHHSTSVLSRQPLIHSSIVHRTGPRETIPPRPRSLQSHHRHPAGILPTYLPTSLLTRGLAYLKHNPMWCTNLTATTTHRVHQTSGRRSWLRFASSITWSSDLVRFDST